MRPERRRNEEEPFFHATLYRDVDSILEHGLRPRQGGGLFQHGGYDHHSQGKVFLARGFSAALSWFSKIEDMAEYHASDQIDLDERVIVLLRVRPSPLVPAVDPLGDRDISGSFYVTGTIPASRIEWWHPDRGWAPLSSWGSVDVDRGVERWDEDTDEDDGDAWDDGGQRGTPILWSAYERGGFKPSTEEEASAPAWKPKPVRRAPPSPPSAAVPAAPDWVPTFKGPPTLEGLGLTPEELGAAIRLRVHYLARPEERAAKVAALLADRWPVPGVTGLTAPGPDPHDTGDYWQIVLKVDPNGRDESRAERVERLRRKPRTGTVERLPVGSEPGTFPLTLGDHDVRFDRSTLRYAVREDGLVHLSSLRTPAAARRKGSARRAMEAFLVATDAGGLPVELWASPLNEQTSRGRLVRFYASLGFRPAGRTANPAGDPVMRRPAPTKGGTIERMTDVPPDGYEPYAFTRNSIGHRDHHDALQAALGILQRKPYEIDVGWDNPQAIGCGAFGCAFVLRDDPRWIVKLTSDPADAAAWQHVITTAHENPALAHTRLVFALPPHKGVSLFGIVQERLQPLSAAEQGALTDYRWQFAAAAGGQDPTNLIRHLLHAWTQDEYVDRHAALERAAAFVLGLRALHAAGVVVDDVKGENVLGDAAGSWRMIDLGASKVPRVGVPDLAELDPATILPRSGDTVERLPTTGGPETPAFRTWFGASKVVDADGRPLVVHHGTSRRFTEFRPSPKAHLGFHFGTEAAARQKLATDAAAVDGRDRRRARYLRPEEERRAEQVQRTRRTREIEDARRKVHRAVSDRNPPSDLDALAAAFDRGGDAIRVHLAAIDAAKARPTPHEQAELDRLDAEERSLQEVTRATWAWGVPASRVFRAYLSVRNPWEGQDCNWGDPAKIRRANPQLRGSTLAEIRDHLEEGGYDGITYVNEVEDPGSTSWIAFRPTQVKSADHNQGTYDPEDPNVERLRTKTGGVHVGGGASAKLRADVTRLLSSVHRAVRRDGRHVDSCDANAEHMAAALRGIGWAARVEMDGVAVLDEEIWHEDSESWRDRIGHDWVVVRDGTSDVVVDSSIRQFGGQTPTYEPSGTRDTESNPAAGGGAGPDVERLSVKGAKATGACGTGIYHVTPREHLARITVDGLLPDPPDGVERSFPQFAKWKHQLKHRTYLAIGHDAAARWWHAVRLSRQGRAYDATPKNASAAGSDPTSWTDRWHAAAPDLVLLRVRPDREARWKALLQRDAKGARDVHPCSYFVQDPIPASDLEWADVSSGDLAMPSEWSHGLRWSPVTSGRAGTVERLRAGPVKDARVALGERLAACLRDPAVRGLLVGARYLDRIREKEDPWSHGGCWILAEALRRTFGRGAACVAVQDDAGRVYHVLTAHAGGWWDDHGFHADEAAALWIAPFVGVPLRLVPLRPGRAHASGVPRPIAVVQKLARVLADLTSDRSVERMRTRGGGIAEAMKEILAVEPACIAELGGDLLVCSQAAVRVGVILDRYGVDAQEETGVYVGPGFESGRTHPEPPGYWHHWVRLRDGTILDVARSQFGESAPLVVPPFDPAQAWFLPDTGGDEYPSGYYPVGPSPWTDLGSTVEKCPCGSSQDPAKWLKDDHAEIRGFVADVARLLKGRKFEAAKRQFAILSAELDVHFRTEEDSVFARLSAARHLTSAQRAHLGNLRKEHVGLRMEIARIGEIPNLTGFDGLAVRLEAHADAEDALLLPAPGGARGR